MNTTTKKALFDLGDVVITPGAEHFLEANQVLPLRLLGRHLFGVWGDLEPDDHQANREALHTGGRLLSSYTVGSGRIWVITEADCSATTLLLPSEY